MKFKNFLDHFGEIPVIDSSSFALMDEKPADLRRQVSGWIKKGYLLQLKKGVYILGSAYRKIEPSPRFIANYLVMPSYLSLEYALGYYDLIPEKVTVYSSLTTKKTQSFTNSLGRFEYNSIKENLFFGFTKAGSGSQAFFIASPEKTLLDFFYFRGRVRGGIEGFDSFRFQNLEILKIKRFHEFMPAYPKRVKKTIRAFIDFAKEERSSYRDIR